MSKLYNADLYTSSNSCNRLNGLSAEQIRLVRDYEERSKRRETLLEQMDRKIRAS